ncbi:MAG: hypothetical protein AAF204_05355 [Pseudomonadota bacterium]
MEMLTKLFSNFFSGGKDGGVDTGALVQEHGGLIDTILSTLRGIPILGDLLGFFLGVDLDDKPEEIMDTLVDQFTGAADEASYKQYALERLEAVRMKLDEGLSEKVGQIMEQVNDGSITLGETFKASVERGAGSLNGDSSRLQIAIQSALSNSVADVEDTIGKIVSYAPQAETMSAPEVTAEPPTPTGS